MIHRFVTPQIDYPALKAFASLAGLVVASLALGWWLAPRGVAMSVVRQDLSEATFVEIRETGGNVVMSGELRNRVDAIDGIEKDAALLGPRSERVIGEIEIEIPRPDSPDQRQELEVDVISLAPRETYHVYINDRRAASFTTDDRGSVDVEYVSN